MKYRLLLLPVVIAIVAIDHYLLPGLLQFVVFALCLWGLLYFWDGDPRRKAAAASQDPPAPGEEGPAPGELCNLCEGSGQDLPGMVCPCCKGTGIEPDYMGTKICNRCGQFSVPTFPIAGKGYCASCATRYKELRDAGGKADRAKIDNSAS